MFLTSLSGASNVHKSLKTTGIASREPLGALTNGNNTRYVFYKDRSSDSTPECILDRNAHICVPKDMFENVHSSTIQNISKLETNQTHFNSRLDKLYIIQIIEC